MEQRRSPRKALVLHRRHGYLVAIPLDSALQAPFESAFDAVLNAASTNARLTATGRISEVSWLVEFQAAVQSTLAASLRAARKGSVEVESVFAHGQPYQVTPKWKYGGSVEIGDLLLVVDRVDRGRRLLEREALLLQMKFGKPSLGPAPARGRSDARQGELFATWPDFDWKFSPMNALPPNPPRRCPCHRPCDASQFGIIKDKTAISVTAKRRPDQIRTLVSQMARVARLDLGVPATPGSANGWGRIVEDMLSAAPLLSYHGLNSSRTRRVSFGHQGVASVGGSGGIGDSRDLDRDDPGRGCVIVHIGFGPTGVLD